jgi:hypothetical protein
MISLLILAEDDPILSASQHDAHDVVLSIDDNGDGHVLKNRNSKVGVVLEATRPLQWRDFIRTLSL